MIARLMSVALLLVLGTGAEAGIRVKTTCQKNIGDGRILVEDSSVLPSETSTFKVLKFKAARTDGDWAYGPCLLDARP
jgi:hypothetical protein